MKRIITLLICLGLIAPSFADDGKFWLVRNQLSLPTNDQKSFGIAAMYVDLEQPNVVLYIREINQSSLKESNYDITKLSFKDRASDAIKLDLSGRKDIVYVNLPEGLYQISQIDVPHFDLPYKVSTDNQDIWRFKVSRDYVNYIGTLKVSALRSKNAINTVWVNHYAKHLRDLEHKVIESNIGLPITHGAGYTDPFANFLNGSNDD